MSNKDYDVIVVGAGISGMVCANYLARYGKRVLVLEQNYQAGGCMAGFWRKGFYFNSGDQSFESCGLVIPILKELGIFEPKMLGKADYRWKSKRFDFQIRSLDQAKRSLLKAYPSEKGISPLFDKIKEVSDDIRKVSDPERWYVLNKPSLGRLYDFLKVILKAYRWMGPGYKESVLKDIEDTELREFFLRVGFRDMSFFMFAGLWHFFVSDYWYPKHGMQKMFERLVANLRKKGGNIIFNTDVESVMTQANRFNGVKTNKGVFSAKYCIYAGDHKTFVDKILGPEYYGSRYVNQVRAAKLSEAALSVYLGVDIAPDKLKKLMGAYHVMYFPDMTLPSVEPDSDADIHSKNLVEISLINGSDASLAPKGKSSLVLTTLSNAEWMNNWNGGKKKGDRSKEYNVLKMKVARQMVRSASTVVPGLERKIRFMEVGTPLSAIRFTRNSKGASSGWSYDPRAWPASRQRFYHSISTPVKNLYTCGHYSIILGGVPGAVVSGKLAANMVLKRPFFSYWSQK